MRRLEDEYTMNEIYDQLPEPLKSLAEVTGDSIKVKAPHDVDAWYELSPTQGGCLLALMTKDRWLSESIEGDLEHTGDELEELLEEELVELIGMGPFRPFATSGTICGNMSSRANGLLPFPLRLALPSKPWWPCSLNLATWAVKTRKVDAGAHAGLGVSAVNHRRPWHRMRWPHPRPC